MKAVTDWMWSPAFASKQEQSDCCEKAAETHNHGVAWHGVAKAAAALKKICIGLRKSLDTYRGTCLFLPHLVQYLISWEYTI